MQNHKESRIMDAKTLRKAGHKQHEIAEQLGVSSRTIRNYLNGYGDKYKTNRSNKQSKLDNFKAYILDQIETNHDINSQLIYEDIIKQGYTGQKSLFYKFTKKVKDRIKRKIVVRFETIPGLQAQVDWKELGYKTLATGRVKLYAFMMVLGYSRKPFTMITTSMKSNVLLKCHIEAFKYFNAVPHEILYDNMKTAFVLSNEGRWCVNRKLQQFANHYGFIAKRCKVRRPQTKGKVERAIGFMSTNFLPRIIWDEHDLDGINDKVIRWMKNIGDRKINEFNQSRNERFLEDEKHMQAIPDIEFDVRIIGHRKVNLRSYISWNSIKFSVPPEYLEREVIVKDDEYQNELSIYCDGKLIRKHSYNKKNKNKIYLNLNDQKQILKLHKKELIDFDKESIEHKIKKANNQLEVGSPKIYEQLCEEVS